MFIYLGVGHGYDILLLFAPVPDAKLTENDVKIINVLLDLLASFASSGYVLCLVLFLLQTTTTDEFHFLEYQK